MAASEYVLQPRPPVRAFLIAAVACLASAALVALSVSQQWHVVVTVLFALIGVFGLVLMAAGFASIKRNQVFITLDDDGYRITGLGQVREGRWREVTKVTETVDRRHITIYHGDVQRTHLLRPSGTDSEQFSAVLTDIARRLDTAHGYGVR